MIQGVIESRLEQLGIILPEGSAPAANYTNYVISNGLIFVSGKGPAGKPKGKLGQAFTTQDGYQFARQTGLEVLAVLKMGLGHLDHVKRVVKIQAYVNADPSFEEHHLVLNGFSDLMLDIFGEQGQHARSVMGANSLRDNLPIVVDCIFEVAGT
jgi:enamine deaminase RidA (YjgF/YER057c/UK114 family)